MRVARANYPGRTRMERAVYGNYVDNADLTHDGTLFAFTTWDHRQPARSAVFEGGPAGSRNDEVFDRDPQNR